MVSQNSPSVSMLTSEISHLCRLYSKLWCFIATGHVCWSSQSQSVLADSFLVTSLLYWICAIILEEIFSYFVDIQNMRINLTFKKIDSQHLLCQWLCALHCIASCPSTAVCCNIHRICCCSYKLWRCTYLTALKYLCLPALHTLQNVFISAASYDPL